MFSPRSGLWRAVVIGGMLLATCSCTPGPAGQGATTDGPSPRNPAHSLDLWPFWPARMRVHPLTRVARDDQGPVIDLRLEFYDESGDTTRCFGEAQIDLVEIPADPALSTGGAAMQWNLDLRDLQLNRTHFDDITRTYLIRLRPGDGSLPSRSEIRVMFTSANGAVLRASQRL